MQKLRLSLGLQQLSLGMQIFSEGLGVQSTKGLRILCGKL